MASRKEMEISDGVDTRESERAMRLCLKGSWGLPCYKAKLPAWEAWSGSQEVTVLAGHVLAVVAMAQCGDFSGIVAADAGLGVGTLATFPEDLTPAAPDALWKNLHRALARRTMPGHLATLCAVNAVTFHLGALTALQTVFFLEWLARQKPATHSGIAPTLQRFLVSNSPFVRQLPQFIRSHESTPRSRFSIS